MRFITGLIATGLFIYAGTADNVMSTVVVSDSDIDGMMANPEWPLEQDDESINKLNSNLVLQMLNDTAPESVTLISSQSVESTVLTTTVSPKNPKKVRNKLKGSRKGFRKPNLSTTNDMHVVPDDQEARIAGTDGTFGGWRKGRLTNYPNDYVTGVRIGYTQPDQQIVDKSFVDWIEFVTAKGDTLRTLSTKSRKRTKVIIDTTSPTDVFFTPNFTMTGFMVQRKNETINMEPVGRQERLRLKQPDAEGWRPNEKFGITDIKIFGYTQQSISNSSNIIKTNVQIGPFFSSTIIPTKYDVQWQSKIECPENERVMGLLSRYHLSRIDSAGLVGMRIVCSKVDGTA